MNKTDIDATLNNGIVTKKKYIWIVYTELLICIIGVILAIAFIILALTNVFSLDKGNIFALCFLIIILLSLITLIKYGLVRNKHLEEYISECLKDAVYVSANIQKYNSISPYAKLNQVIITFKIDKKEYSFLSKAQHNKSNRFYLKFIGNNVKLLYSSKYNDILFFKQS